jgi:hypothetical protein
VLVTHLDHLRELPAHRDALGRIAFSHGILQPAVGNPFAHPRRITPLWREIAAQGILHRHIALVDRHPRARALAVLDPKLVPRPAPVIIPRVAHDKALLPVDRHAVVDPQKHHVVMHLAIVADGLEGCAFTKQRRIARRAIEHPCGFAKVVKAITAVWASDVRVRHEGFCSEN